MADGNLDNLLSGGWIGEISGEDQEVGGRLDGVIGEEGIAGVFKPALGAGDEDETRAGAAVDAGELQAETGGAAGDQDDGAVFGGRGAWAEKPGGGNGGEGDGDLGGARGV